MQWSRNVLILEAFTSVFPEPGLHILLGVCELISGVRKRKMVSNMISESKHYIIILYFLTV